MGARDSFHDYATRIELICNEFSLAHRRGASRDELVRITKPAADLLNTLAIGVRGDQDFKETTRPATHVGSLLNGAAAIKPSEFRATYRAPFSALPGAEPLELREAFNKIVHKDPADASYYIDESNYEIIIGGKSQNGTPWLAVISLPKLLATVKALPDRLIPEREA
jgi:hypothetical protein